MVKLKARTNIETMIASEVLFRMTHFRFDFCCSVLVKDLNYALVSFGCLGLGLIIVPLICFVGLFSTQKS